jgi:hypothetical protein
MAWMISTWQRGFPEEKRSLSAVGVSQEESTLELSPSQQGCETPQTPISSSNTSWVISWVSATIWVLWKKKKKMISALKGTAILLERWDPNARTHKESVSGDKCHGEEMKGWSFTIRQTRIQIPACPLTAVCFLERWLYLPYILLLRSMWSIDHSSTHWTNIYKTLSCVKHCFEC